MLSFQSSPCVKPHVCDSAHAQKHSHFISHSANAFKIKSKFLEISKSKVLGSAKWPEWVNHGAMTLTIMTLRLTTFTMITLSIKGILVTLSINECDYADCHVLFVVMLTALLTSVIMLSVVTLNVIVLKVTAPHPFLRS